MAGLRRGDWRGYIADAAAKRPSILRARAVIAMSAIYWRSEWKYRARAYRYCYWDAGTILANLLAAAAAEEISAEVITAFEDPALETLLGIDGEREGMIALIALGRTDEPAAPSPAVEPLTLETIPLSSKEVAYPDLVKMHRESRLVTADEVATVSAAKLDSAQIDRRARARFISKPSRPKNPRDLARRSCAADRREHLRRKRSPPQNSRRSWPLRASIRRPTFLPLTDTYLIVNAAEGLEPGAYYYNRDSRAFELLKAGNFRGEAGYLCLEQPLGMDCSALVVYMADLERALGAFGNRGYGDAHLEAGILGGRAYLAAYSLGRGATGLTFYDDDTTKFFEPHAAGKSPLLMVALGVPRRQVAQ